MMGFLEIIGLSVITCFITSVSDPIQWIKEKAKLDQFKLLNCEVCLGFWVGLSYYNFIYAPMLSVQGAIILSVFHGCLISLVSALIMRYGFR